MRSARSARTPRVEQLEGKQMLAGDVVVSVDDGRLSIRGDELDNQIAIRSADEEGAFLIVGLDGTNLTILGDDGQPPADASTTPDGAVLVTGVRSADVRMGDGDDTVLVNDARFAGALNIATGAGGDTVVVGAPVDGDAGDDAPVDPAGDQGEPVVDGPSVVVGRTLRIATGGDGDTVRVGSASIGRNLSVSTGDGGDRVGLGAPATTDGDGDGNDDPAVEAVSTEDQPATLRVRGAVSVALGEGDDAALANDVAARSINGFGGRGDDEITVANSRAGRLWLRGGVGEGEDTLRVVNSNARAAWINSGAGADRVEVVDSAFGLLAAWLGEGDDELLVRGNTARLALLFGGPGDADALLGLDTNDFGRQVVRGFELPATEDEEEEATDEALAV